MNATQAASKFLNKNAGRIGGLYHRWQDEKQYEDFKDYTSALKKLVESQKGFFFVTAKQRPFSFDFRVYDNTSFRVVVKANTLDLFQLAQH